MKRRYEYFLSYTFKEKDGCGGQGNMNLFTSSTIKSMDDLREIKRAILRDNPSFEDIVISNFIKF